MLVTQPGVTADTGDRARTGLAINGRDRRPRNFMLDGLENNNYLVTGSMDADRAGGVEEYRVSTNHFSASTPYVGYLANA